MEGWYPRSTRKKMNSAVIGTKTLADTDVLAVDTKTPTQAAKSGPLEWGTLSCKFILINKLIEWATRRKKLK